MTALMTPHPPPDPHMAFTTRKSLLAKAQNGEETSWQEFYSTYQPLITLCGRDCGLTNDEIEDLVQLVMCEIFQKDILAKYDPDNVPEHIVFKHDHTKGRFRYFLRAIIRNQALKLYRKRKAQPQTEELTEQSAEDDTAPAFDDAYDDAWRKHLLSQAMIELKNHVQPDTYTAFDMYAIQERPIEEVTSFLNITANSVYVAKSRCIETLKNIIKKLDQGNTP